MQMRYSDVQLLPLYCSIVVIVIIIGFSSPSFFFLKVERVGVGAEGRGGVESPVIYHLIKTLNLE